MTNEQLLLDHIIVGSCQPKQGVAQSVPELIVTCFSCGHMTASNYHLHLAKILKAEVEKAKTEAWLEAYRYASKLLGDPDHEVIEDQVAEIKEACYTADSILSLLRYRGIVNSEMNRDDVAEAQSKMRRITVKFDRSRT